MMWESIEARLAAIFGRFDALVTGYPLLFGSYLALLAPLTAVTVWLIWRRQARAALWGATAIVLVAFLFSRGDDTLSHVFRAAALANQVRAGTLSLLLDEPTGEVLPIFVYYSLLPYLLPVALDLLGLSGIVAFKVTGCLQFLVMVLGVQVLIDRTSLSPRGMSRREGTGEFLIAVLFVCANYVYSLWNTRASLGELWVYALIPWVVVGTLSSGWARWLTLAFFLQACAHPIVLAHSLACEAVVAYGLSRLPLWEVARRWAVALALALVLAVPFWLPPALLQDHIMGPAALPVDFADSFQSIAELLDPRSNRNIGLWMPLAILLMVVAARGRLSGRVWLVTASWIALMALQSVYLRGVAQLVPTLSLSLFVWRLMLPAAFLGFGALLAGWRELEWPVGLGLVPLSMLSVLTLAVLSVSAAPYHLPKVASASGEPRAMLTEDSGREAEIWGIREYLPDYRPLSRSCPTDVQLVSFQDLRRGVKADLPFVAVRLGPLGIVDYEAEGAPLQPASCGNDLVLGPLMPDTVVRASETTLDRLLWLRLLGLPTALLVILLLVPSRRRRRAAG